MTEFAVFKKSKDGAEEVWHRRLGHSSNTIFDLFPTVGSRNKDFSTCGTCLRAKQCREMFHSNNNKSDEIFDLIHCDLWGPYREASVCHAYNFLTIVGDNSRAVWVYILNDKMQVKQTLQNFLALIQCYFDKKIKMIRSDNGTGFVCMTYEWET